MSRLGLGLGLHKQSAMLPFSPLSVSDLAFWYDPFDLSSMVIDGSNRVSLWADKSPWSRVNGLVLNGLAGNYASAPDSAAVSITGDIDIRVQAALVDWTPSANAALVCKANAPASTSYEFLLLSSGLLYFVVSNDGTAVVAAQSSAATGLADHAQAWVRVTWRRSDGQTLFYTSTDGTAWTQLGTAATANLGADIYDGATALKIGARYAGANDLPIGLIYRAQIYNGIAGTLAFDADFSTFSKLAATGTESSSNAATVTINTSGATGARISGARDLYQGTVANQPVYSVVDGVPRITTDGSGDFFKSPAFPFVQPETVQMVMSQVSWTNGRPIIDGGSNDTMELYQDGVTPNITQYGGATGATITSIPVGQLGVVSAFFNGANSGVRFNRGAAVTGNAGTSAANGFTLAQKGGAAANTANITAGEIIGRSSLAATSTYEQDRVIRYLARRGRIAA